MKKISHLRIDTNHFEAKTNHFHQGLDSLHKKKTLPKYVNLSKKIISNIKLRYTTHETPGI